MRTADESGEDFNIFAIFGFLGVPGRAKRVPRGAKEGAKGETRRRQERPLMVPWGPLGIPWGSLGDTLGVLWGPWAA